MRLFPSVLLFLLALAGRPSAQAFDFAGTADAYLAELEWEGESFEALLDSRHFLRLPIGGFDVRFPAREDLDDAAAEELRDVLGVALRLQEAWAAWTLVEGDALEEAEDDAERLRKWIERLSRRKLERAAEGGGSLLVALEADERTVVAVERFRERLVPRSRGIEGEIVTRPAVVVLAPERSTYVKLVAAVGRLQEASRDRIWTDAHLFTPNAWALGAQIVPLRHPAHPYDVATAMEGWEIERYLTSSLEQHAAQRFAASHLSSVFHWDTDPLLETALAKNLEIACLGEVKLVNDFSSFRWSRAGGSTQPYARFVPGGNSGGGLLPKREARGGPTVGTYESDLQVEEIGHRAFLENLRERQKAGAELARGDRELEPAQRRDDEVHFAVSAGDDRHRVTAPFLGAPSEEKTFPPLVFLDDYEDFFTAYRSAFLEWLRTESGDEAEERFARLLERMAAARDGEGLGEACREVYGRPLGHDPAAEATLEGEFLEDLADRR